MGRKNEIKGAKTKINDVYLSNKILLLARLYRDLMVNLHRPVCRLVQSRVAGGRTDPHAVDKIVVELVIREVVAVTGHLA